MNYEKMWPWVAGALLLLLIVSPTRPNPPNTTYEELAKEVIISEGFTLPVQWGDLGKQMVESGVIDEEKFIKLYEQRGGMTEEMKQLLLGGYKGNLVMNKENSGFILNLLWAFGLSNQNRILTEGTMADPKYGGSDRFASTGGWRLAIGDTMEHYSAHIFISLTTEQQELVERVSKNIYRPCCGNSTYFPDCNHGMAMLGLLELMASQGVGEDEMYSVALQVNSYWFPDTYLAIAKYFALRGVSWKQVNAKEVLGSLYSSATGYQQILAEIEPPKNQGGGCGV
ncbi:MAG: hypothetical protein KJI69_01270 [Patescibacteria group bacterium]|nr:hypothetical protein [Patescibacteria group bacterium]